MVKWAESEIRSGISGTGGLQPVLARRDVLAVVNQREPILVRPFPRTILRRNLLCGAIATCFSMVAGANPLDPTVVSGGAVFTTTGNTLRIENTPSAIINWQSFSIGAGELTHFQQQSAASQVLNRVTGGNPSVILGTITSNGFVALINVNGITFGPGSVVDVAGLLASTLNVTNADFLAGRLSFHAPLGTAGIIRNDGTLRAASGGRIYLVAPSIENHGIITAPDGTVILVAGHSITLVDSNRPDVQVQLTAGTGEVLNVGTIVASNIGIYAATLRFGNNAPNSANTAVLGDDGVIRLSATGGQSISADTLTIQSNVITNAHGGSLQQGGSGVSLANGGTITISGSTGGVGIGNGGTITNSGSTNGAANGGNVTISSAGSTGGGPGVTVSSGGTTPRATKNAVITVEKDGAALLDPSTANVTAADRGAQFPFQRPRLLGADTPLLPSFR